MSSNQSKKRKISISTKIEIAEFLQTPGSSLKKAMQKFQVSRGTVQRAKKQTTELMYQKENNRNTKMSRLHNTTPLNTLVFRWFSLVRLQGFPISGPIMQEKAKQLALLLGIDNFHASDGWLASLKKRNMISLRAISGEAGNAEISADETWKNSLQSLCVGYDSKTIFNMDETGYFYRTFPDKTLEVKAKSCKGGKLSKDRITLALTCSMKGEKLPALVIGKSKNPRCFRGINI